MQQPVSPWRHAERCGISDRLWRSSLQMAVLPGLLSQLAHSHLLFQLHPALHLSARSIHPGPLLQRVWCLCAGHMRSVHHRQKRIRDRREHRSQRQDQVPDTMQWRLLAKNDRLVRGIHGHRPMHILRHVLGRRQSHKRQCLRGLPSGRAASLISPRSGQRSGEYLAEPRSQLHMGLPPRSLPGHPAQLLHCMPHGHVSVLHQRHFHRMHPVPTRLLQARWPGRAAVSTGPSLCVCDLGQWKLCVQPGLHPADCQLCRQSVQPLLPVHSDNNKPVHCHHKPLHVHAGFRFLVQNPELLVRWRLLPQHSLYQSHAPWRNGLLHYLSLLLQHRRHLPLLLRQDTGGTAGSDRLWQLPSMCLSRYRKGSGLRAPAVCARLLCQWDLPASHSLIHHQRSLPLCCHSLGIPAGDCAQFHADLPALRHYSLCGRDHSSPMSKWADDQSMRVMHRRGSLLVHGFPLAHRLCVGLCGRLLFKRHLLSALPSRHLSEQDQQYSLRRRLMHTGPSRLLHIQPRHGGSRPLPKRHILLQRLRIHGLPAMPGRICWRIGGALCMHSVLEWDLLCGRR